MTRSTATFDRWKSREQSTWPFQVFKKYTNEYERMFWTHVTSKRFVYSQLGKIGAQLEDDVEKHFEVKGVDRENLYVDINDWTLAFNQFDNWTNLNGLMAISANLETYMASVVRLALESNPGTIFDASKKIDGIQLLKNAGRRKLAFDDEVKSCTKGDWSSRISAYTKIFGGVPKILSDKCSELDAIRKIRNNVGHAFGRDIDDSRDHGVKIIVPMETVTLERAVKYKKLIWDVAKAIDKHLLIHHVGEFQIVRFYHQKLSILDVEFDEKARITRFRKEIGRFGAALRGKDECKGLIEYYNSL